MPGRTLSYRSGPAYEGADMKSTNEIIFRRGVNFAGTGETRSFPCIPAGSGGVARCQLRQAGSGERRAQ